MTTSSIPAQTTQIVWRIPALAWIAIAIAVAAEACINALRAYGLGQHLERFTVHVSAFGWDGHVSIAGVVLVFAAVAVSLSQARAAWIAFAPGAMIRQRVLGIPLTALLLSVSVTAMAITLYEAQRAKTADETGQTKRYDRAKGAFDDVTGQVNALKRFGDKKDALPRPREAVQAEIERLKIDWGIWSRSKKCTDISREESKDACAPVLALYEEQGAFASLVQLEPKLLKAKADLDALPRPEEASASEMTITDVWNVLMGIAVVVIATFGSVLFARPVETNAPDVPTLEQRMAAFDVDQHVGTINGRVIEAPKPGVKPMMQKTTSIERTASKSLELKGRVLN